MVTPTPTTVQVQLQLRGDTAATWASVNPVLLNNELGLETDTKKIKIGNGSTAWNSLAYFPSIVTGGTVLGNLEIGTTGTLTFEGSTANGFETTLAVTDPTADRTITLPDQSGTVVVTGNASIVDADIAADAEIAVSKLADGAARQLLQTDAAGTGVEWTDNVDVPGTLDVTGAATFDDDVTIEGDLTVNGTTTTIDTETLLVKDKNIELAVVETPTDTTADGGGITLKGATDKTITWSDTSDSWEFNQPTITTGNSSAAAFVPTGSTVPTNGVYLPGTNQLGLATNGTGRLFVDSSGNVDVQATSSTVTRIAGGASLFVKRAETSYDSPSAITTSVNIGGIAARGYGNTDYRSVGNLLFATNGAVSDTSSPGYAFVSTTPSGSVTPVERARIDSSGRLLVGTSSALTTAGALTAKLQAAGNSVFDTGISTSLFTADANPVNLQLAKSRNTTTGSHTVVQNNDSLGRITFAGSDGTDFEAAAWIEGQVDGTPGANDMPGRLVFSTTADGASSPTERMRITSDGDFLIEKTAIDQTTQGFQYDSGGAGLNATVTITNTRTDSGPGPFRLNRQGSDGTLIHFLQAATEEGSISVSGTTVSYNGAHLSRWSQLPGGAERTEILRGTVLSNIDEMCGWGEEENEQLNRMKVSDVEGDPNVSGVFQNWDDSDDVYTDDFYCAMTGDFIIRIAEGVTVQRGELLMSAGDGTAKPQDDDIIRSKTIAKVTSTHVTCTYDDGSYCVPCVLMAC